MIRVDVCSDQNLEIPQGLLCLSLMRIILVTAFLFRIIIATSHNNESGRPPAKELVNTKPYNLQGAHKLPLADLIANRPPSKEWSPCIFPQIFARNEEVSAIDLTQSPEHIAKAFWKLRLKGLEQYEAHKYNHRFSRAMLEYLRSKDLQPEIIRAIRGYHSLKMRAHREHLLRNNCDTFAGQRRTEYLKDYRARKYAKKMVPESKAVATDEEPACTNSIKQLERM